MVIKRERVVISKKARNSIKQIYTYLKSGVSIETAEKVKSGIIEKCAKLKDFSGYSKEPYLEEFEEDYRSVSIWEYVIIYRITDKEVRILNIIHGRMNPSKRKNV